MNSKFHNNYTVDLNTGCWIWNKFRQPTGYGHCKWAGRMRLAHRVSWEIHNGPISHGLLVLHKCDNPGCVNPDHLFLGSNTDNSKDMVDKGRQARQPGEKNGNAKLTWEKAASIRKDKRKLRTIAKEYDISVSVVSCIKTGKSWVNSGA